MKGNPRHAPCLYSKEALSAIEGMPGGSLEVIIARHAEMVMAHPSMEAHGRRIIKAVAGT